MLTFCSQTNYLIMQLALLRGAVTFLSYLWKLKSNPNTAYNLARVQNGYFNVTEISPTN